MLEINENDTIYTDIITEYLFNDFVNSNYDFIYLNMDTMKISYDTMDNNLIRIFNKRYLPRFNSYDLFLDECLKNISDYYSRILSGNKLYIEDYLKFKCLSDDIYIKDSIHTICYEIKKYVNIYSDGYDHNTNRNSYEFASILNKGCEYISLHTSNWHSNIKKLYKTDLGRFMNFKIPLTENIIYDFSCNFNFFLSDTFIFIDIENSLDILKDFIIEYDFEYKILENLILNLKHYFDFNDNNSYLFDSFLENLIENYLNLPSKNSTDIILFFNSIINKKDYYTFKIPCSILRRLLAYDKKNSLTFINQIETLYFDNLFQLLMFYIRKPITVIKNAKKIKLKRFI